MTTIRSALTNHYGDYFVGYVSTMNESYVMHSVFLPQPLPLIECKTCRAYRYYTIDNVNIIQYFCLLRADLLRMPM